MTARVLVVEDESLVAMVLEDCLEALGYEVAASVANVDAALEVVRAGGVDLAVLDVNLAGSASYPVAEALDAQGVPYIFITGYGQAAIAENFRHRYGLQKPFRMRDLQGALATMQPNAGQQPEAM